MQRQRQKLSDGSAKEVPSEDRQPKTLTHWPELNYREATYDDLPISLADLRAELRRYRAELRGYVKEIQAGAVPVGLVENILHETELYVARADRLVSKNGAAREAALRDIETQVSIAIHESANYSIEAVRSAMAKEKEECEATRNSKYDHPKYDDSHPVTE